jgi:hypothetical protein
LPAYHLDPLRTQLVNSLAPESTAPASPMNCWFDFGTMVCILWIPALIRNTVPGGAALTRAWILSPGQIVVAVPVQPVASATIVTMAVSAFPLEASAPITR